MTGVDPRVTIDTSFHPISFKGPKGNMDPSSTLGNPSMRSPFALKPALFAEQGLIPFHIPFINSIVAYVEDPAWNPTSVSIKANLRLCHGLVLTAFHQEMPTRFVQNPSNASFIKPQYAQRGKDWLLGKAQKSLKSIDPDRVDKEGMALQYWSIKAQIEALSGRLEDAESLLDLHFPDQESSWHIFQAYRALVFSTFHKFGPRSALRCVVRKWDTLSPALLGKHGVQVIHSTRTHGDLFRGMIFNILDEEERDIAEWYAELRVSPGRRIFALEPSVAASEWSREQHSRLGSILIAYSTTRLQAIESIAAFTPIHWRALVSLPKLLDHMLRSKYTIPVEELLLSVRLLTRWGDTESAERLLEQAPSQPQKPQASISNGEHPNSLKKGAYRLSSELQLAARQGDILRAQDVFTALLKQKSIQKRDVRQLLLAYTRAPVYEARDISPLTEYDELSHETASESFPAHQNIPTRLDDAEELFNRVIAPHRPSVADYSVIIYAHARRGDVEAVHNLFKRMVEDGIPQKDIPWYLALQAFAVAGNAEAVLQVLGHMKQLTAHSSNNEGRYKPTIMNTSTFNILMELMARRRDADNARKLWLNGVVYGGIQPNLASVTKLMRAYAEAGQWHGVVRAWDYLQSEASEKWRKEGIYGRSNNIAIYNLVLRAYVAIGAPFHIVSRLFRQMVQDRALGAEPDSFTYTMLIISAVDNMHMDSAIEWFNQMEEMERRKGLPRQLQDEEMQASVHGTSRPRTIDYRPIYALTYLLAGFLRQTDWERARWIYEEIKRRGLVPLPLTYALITQSYTAIGGRTGDGSGFEVAEHFLRFVSGHSKGMPKSTLKAFAENKKVEPAYTPLLAKYVQSKARREVERLFDEMTALGGDASVASLTTLLDVYRRIGDVEMVRETWIKILELADAVIQDEEKAVSKIASFGEENSELAMVGSSHAILCYPFSIYMDALSAAGHHAEVASEWQRLADAGFSFDAHNWNHLVIVLVRAGEVEKAFEVVENVILAYAFTSSRIANLGLKDVKSPVIEDDIDPSTLNVHMSWKRRRSFSVGNPLSQRLSEFKNLSEPSVAPKDFVHELQVLHEVHRSRNYWRPHRNVLMVLGRALQHMESGRAVLPIGASGDTEVASSEVFASLARIVNLYPKAATLAYSKVQDASRSI